MNDEQLITLLETSVKKNVMKSIGDDLEGLFQRLRMQTEILENRLGKIEERIIKVQESQALLKQHVDAGVANSASLGKATAEIEARLWQMKEYQEIKFKELMQFDTRSEKNVNVDAGQP